MLYMNSHSDPRHTECLNLTEAMSVIYTHIAFMTTCILRPSYFCEI